MSCGRTSIWAHVSAAHLMGESCDHGIAFGSPAQEANETTKNKCEHEYSARRERKETVVGYTSCS